MAQGKGWRTALHSVIKEGLFGKIAFKLRLKKMKKLIFRKLCRNAYQAEERVSAKALKNLGCSSN